MHVYNAVVGELTVRDILHEYTALHDTVTID